MAIVELSLIIDPSAERPVQPQLVLAPGNLSGAERAALNEWAAKAFGPPACTQITPADGPMTAAQGAQLIAEFARVNDQFAELTSQLRRHLSNGRM